MSSLRNAVKRKTHKERPQPSARRQYGLLEKKKDYQLRAKDFHKKEKAIQDLRQKAEERNPDEFYFAMQNRRTKGGVDIGKDEANKYSQEELRLMKTQDVGYLNLKAQTESRRIEKLRGSLHFIGSITPRSHVVFVEDAVAVRTFSAEQHFDTAPELLGRTFNRPEIAQLANAAATNSSADLERVAGKVDRKRAAAYKELLQRSERQEKLCKLAAKLVSDKELMGKGTKRKQRSATAAGPAAFKWKRERKK